LEGMAPPAAALAPTNELNRVAGHRCRTCFGPAFLFLSVLLFALAEEVSTLDPVPGAFCFEPPAFAKTLKLALKLRLGHPPLYRGKPQDYGGPPPFPVATRRSGTFG